MNYHLAIDIGTTTIKGIVYDATGCVHTGLSKQSTTFSPQIAFMEQDPDAIFKSVTEIINHLSFTLSQQNKVLNSIVLSAYMHGIMAVDKLNTPLTNCIIWSDNRSEAYVGKYKENGIGLNIYKKTGTPVHPMSPFYKLMWLRDNKPDIFKKAYKFISVKEYILKKITGKYIADYSIASATGMFNIHELRWEDSALKEVGISAEKLSQTVPTTAVYEQFTKEFTNKIGGDCMFKLVTGSSDGCLANLGSHGLNINTAVITLGTSGAVRLVSSRPIIDDNARMFSYILCKDFFVSGGATNNGGLIFDWFKKIFTEISDIDAFLSGYKNKKNGLLFLPFLNGERAPYWNAKLRGSFLGIQNNHTKQDFLFSALQGSCFAVKDVFEILLASNPKLNSIYVNGGFTKSKTWVSLLAAVLGRPLHILNQGDAACFGAFLLGMKALGVISSWADCENYFNKAKEYVCQKDEQYEKMFELYKRSIQQNTKILETLSDIQSGK